jgi:hypothetical protein
MLNFENIFLLKVTMPIQLSNESSHVHLNHASMGVPEAKTIAVPVRKRRYMTIFFKGVWAGNDARIAHIIIPIPKKKAVPVQNIQKLIS